MFIFRIILIIYIYKFLILKYIEKFKSIGFQSYTTNSSFDLTLYNNIRLNNSHKNLLFIFCFNIIMVPNILLKRTIESIKKKK